MNNLITVFLIVVCMDSIHAQLQVSANTDVFADDNAIFYSNENFINDGNVSINQNTRFVFDKDFTNNSNFNYENGSNKGVFVIGSGDATRSNGAQSISFHPSTEEVAPFIELNKVGGTATINRGLMRLKETFVATSGTLDAASSISGEESNVTVEGLVFASDDTNTAVIDQSSNGVVNNIIIERFIPASNRAFRAFSSSLNTNGSIRENLMEGGQITTAGGTDNPRPGYGTHITGSANTSNGFDITNSNNPSMFQYTNPNADTFTAVPDTNGSMSAGESYLLFVRGGRDVDLSSNSSVGANPTRLRMLGDAYVGNFNASSVSTMPTQQGAYASIGNPYQAQVNLEDVLSSASTTGVAKNKVYVYDPTIGTDHGSWVTLSFSETSEGSGIYEFDTATPSSAANQFLQPNQAFYIESNSAIAPEVRFEESFKRATDPSSTVAVFSDTSSTHFNVRFDLFESTTNNLRDGILVRFGNSYSDNYIQEEDAITFINFLETMASVSQDGSLLSFDKRNINAEGEIVQLSLSNYQDINYSFTITVENNNEQDELFLIDNYLGTETQLDSPTVVYNFSVDQNIPASVDANRFQLGVNTSTFSDDSFELNGISAYPNPVVNSVIIDLSSLRGQADFIRFYDITGKMVKSLMVGDEIDYLNVDMGGLPSGVYILVLETTSKRQFQTKLIKE